jgi:heme A synthase
MSFSPEASGRFARFAWVALIYTLAVIAWGAVVRHTWSGDGCGSHWPLCNGQLIPKTPTTETIIEFVHRLTSFVSLVLAAALVVWSRKVFVAGHVVRKASGLAMFFTLMEAAIGAGLVLLGLTKGNDSAGRAVALSLHLANTLLLLGCIALAAHFAGSDYTTRNRTSQLSIKWIFGVGAAFVMLVAISGAVTSLGDTLFPRSDSAQVVREGLSVTGHFLLRLRLWHPVLALACGLYLVFLAGIVADLKPDRFVIARLRVVVACVLAQMALGLIGVWLKAPLWMALAHLILADLLWLSLLLAAAVALCSDALPRRAQKGVPA